MIKHVSLLIVLSCAVSLHAAEDASKANATAQEEVEIVMPSAQVLAKRLQDDLSLHHFVQKTTITQDLGGQTKYAVGVSVAVELAIDDYAESMKIPTLYEAVQKRKPKIIECLLKDFPAAIKELQDLGVLPNPDTTDSKQNDKKQ